MILDANLKFSDAQSVITADPDSTNIVDQGMALRDAGTGKPLFVVTVVTTAFTDSGSNSTVTVALQGDSTSTITPDATRTLFIIPALAAVGDTFISPLHPRGNVEQYQYINLKYTLTSGDLTTGKVSSYLVQDVQAWVAKANNYTIS